MNELLARKRTLIDRAVEMFDITKEELLQSSRKDPLPAIRYAIFTILRHEGFAICDIAEAFNKNHATVCYGINNTHRACDVVGTNNKLKEIYTSLSAGRQEPVIRTTTTAISKWLTSCSVDPDTKEKLISTISSLSHY